MRGMEGGEEMSRSRCNRDGSETYPGMTRPKGFQIGRWFIECKAFIERKPDANIAIRFHPTYSTLQKSLPYPSIWQ